MTMSDVELTDGAIDTLTKGGKVEKPILQILGCKKITMSQADRYRIQLSDGKNVYPFGMLATQLNDKAANKELETFAVIQIEKHNIISQDNKRIIMILDLTVLKTPDEVGCKIGNPSETATNTPAPTSTVNSHNVTASPSTVVFAVTPSSTSASTFNGSSLHSTIANKLSPSTNSSPSRRVHSITDLSPYQNRWTIRARVTSKTEVRNYSNARGSGKLFTFEMVDSSGEIRATGFNDEVDKFYEMIEVNKIYYIGNCVLKSANKKFSSINNDYEMTLRKDSVIEPCEEQDSEVPTVRFSFVPINQLPEQNKSNLVDVIGVCKRTSDIQVLTQRSTQREIKKRDITLVDQTNTEISLTLWGTQAETFDGASKPVVALKRARISEFGGCSLSTIRDSAIQIDPDIKEARVLKSWFEQEGETAAIQSLSSRGQTTSMSDNVKLLWCITNENLGMGEKADYFSCMASILTMKKDNTMYRACKNENCNKKVVELDSDMYRCDKCKQESSEYKWRLMLSINIGDFTASQWVTCFQDTAEMIMGKTAAELGALREQNNADYQRILDNCSFKMFVFRLKTKMEMFNDENRLKTIVVGISQPNWIESSKTLLQQLQSA